MEVNERVYTSLYKRLICLYYENKNKGLVILVLFPVLKISGVRTKLFN